MSVCFKYKTTISNYNSFIYRMLDYTTSRIPFDRIKQLAKTDREYSMRPEIFEDFVEYMPDIDGFRAAIESNKHGQVDRKLLVDVLRHQYDHVGERHDQIAALEKDNHFTVTTAHQPSLLTGPLYFIYKICSTINLARKLNTELNGHYVHPLMIVGGEDHDFEEVNHLNLFGKSHSWQSNQTGAVGRMNMEDLQPVLEEVKGVLGAGEFAAELAGLIEDCFNGDITYYGQAMQKFVINLFEGTELLVLQMDDPDLKRAFTRIMQDELYSQSSRDLIAQSQAKIAELGHKPQTYIRDINLFYFTGDQRARIERNGESFNIVGQDLSYSDAEMESILKEHPERFSPNVNLRPLFQELILPNLAYIGGGGEIAYWLERKDQFAQFGIPFPILIRRNSVLHINKSMSSQLAKLDIPNDQLFEDPEHVISQWVRSHAEHEVDISQESAQIDSALSQIVDKALDIDPSLARKAEAYKVKTMKEVEHFGKRLIREEKAKNEGTVHKIRKLYGKFFPDGALQERHDNFIAFYLRYGKPYLTALASELDPLTPGFIIIREK